LPTLKAILDEAQNKLDKDQTLINKKMPIQFTGFVDNSQKRVKRRRPTPSMPTLQYICLRQLHERPKWAWQVKPIVAKPIAITNIILYLINEVWDGRHWCNCTILTYDCSCQRLLRK
jgi:hypothetical protein